jgi:hypothetical protein
VQGQCPVDDVQNTQTITESRYPDDHREAGTIEFRAPSGLDKGKSDLVLPSADTKRWSSRRKAAVVVAMRTGAITREEACVRYLLSYEELASWEAAFDRNGIPGLRVSSLRVHRRPYIKGDIGGSAPKGSSPTF